MVEKMHHDVGQQIGNYSLIRLLGRGGFADVYLGEHIYLKTKAAIKMLRVQLSESSRDDFMNEARTIAQLEHPNIVRVLECGITEERTPFLVMAYAPNGSLRQRHTKGTRLPLTQILPYVQQIAAALNYAHQHKLIHRDVKPENMLIGQHDELLLSDFGLALLAQSSSALSTKEMAGTAPYMPPEQLQGKPRFASDQYALAIAAYEWLCGERPFSGTFMEVVSQQVLSTPPSLCEKVPDLSPTVERVIFRALAKDPTKRFESVLAFAQALTEVSHASESNPVFPFALSSATNLSTVAAIPSGSIQSQPSNHAVPLSLSGQSSLMLSAPSTASLMEEPYLSLADQPTMMIARSGASISLSTITPPHLSDIADRATSSSAAVMPHLVPAPTVTHQRRFWQLIVLFTMTLTLLGGSVGLWFSENVLPNIHFMHFRHRTIATATQAREIDTATALSYPGSGGTTPDFTYTTTTVVSPPINHNTPYSRVTPFASPTGSIRNVLPTQAPPTPTPVPPTPTPVPTQAPTQVPPTPTPEPPTPTPVPTQPAVTPTAIDPKSMTPTVMPTPTPTP